MVVLHWEDEMEGRKVNRKTVAVIFTVIALMVASLSVVSNLRQEAEIVSESSPDFVPEQQSEEQTEMLNEQPLQLQPQPEQEPQSESAEGLQEQAPAEPEPQTESEPEQEPFAEEPESEPLAEPEAEAEPTLVYEKVDLEAFADYTITYVNRTVGLMNWTVHGWVKNVGDEPVYNVTVLVKVEGLTGRAVALWKEIYPYVWHFECLQAGETVEFSRDDSFMSGPNGLMLQDCLWEATGFIVKEVNGE